MGNLKYVLNIIYLYLVNRKSIHFTQGNYKNRNTKANNQELALCISVCVCVQHVYVCVAYICNMYMYVCMQHLFYQIHFSLNDKEM